MDAIDTASDDSLQSEDMVATDDALPVQQWTVHQGASKHGKDILVDAQGFSYTAGKQ